MLGKCQFYGRLDIFLFFFFQACITNQQNGRKTIYTVLGDTGQAETHETDNSFIGRSEGKCIPRHGI